ASLNANLIDYNNWQVIDFNNWIELTTFSDKLIGVQEDLSLNTISATNQIDQVSDVWGGFLKFNVSGDVLIEVTHEAARLRGADVSVYKDIVYGIKENGGVNDATYINGENHIPSITVGGVNVSLENKDNILSISPRGPVSNNVSAVTMNNIVLWFTFGGYGP